MKFKSASSNPRVTSLNPRVASLNPRVTSSNPRVQESFTSYSLIITSKSWLVQEFKSQLNSLKSSSFPKTISPKLLDNLWGNLYVPFLVIISCFTFPLLWKKRPKFSTKKSSYPHLFSRILLFPLVNVRDFSFISLTHIFVLCL